MPGDSSDSGHSDRHDEVMTDFSHQPAAVELHQVSHAYASRHHSVTALADVSVAFRTGTWTAVMGTSGSGKSTLLHCAGGLERPTSGRVIVSGSDITDANDSELTALRRTTIGFVFQNFNLIGSLTAEQNVAMPLRLAGKRPRRSEVRAVLDRVGLADRRGHRPRELSGGQQQRVAIARAMVTRPAVLLADEPTGALDSTTSRGLLAMMRAMVVEQQQTIVMVTHDATVAAAADRVLFLADGRIVDEINAPTAPAVADRLARLEVSPAAALVG
jgi:putative ABC transport system ATP-binding protein